MDKTSLDDENTRCWYKDANKIQETYAVNSFPTYLFFNSKGEPVHKAVGYMSADKFVAEAKKAIDPERQYYTVLANYEHGKLDTAALKELAKEYSGVGGELSGKFAAEYLNHIPESDLGRMDVVEFMMGFADTHAVQGYAAKYLSNIPILEYGLPLNSLFISVFKERSKVQDVILKTLFALSTDSVKKHLSLLKKFKDLTVAKEIGSRYLRSLSEKELFTGENIIMLGDFTRSIDEPGFQVFYDEKSAARIDSIFRQQPGHEKLTAKQYANYIFITGDLVKYFNATIKGDSIDWVAVENMFKNKLRGTLWRKMF